MSKRRTTSLIISLVLSFAVLVPQAALGYRDADSAAPVVSDAGPATPARAKEETDAEAPPATEGEAGDATRPKRKGNAFARAITAPFRALARLFGGGGRKSETAKKSAPQLPTAATQSEVSQNNAVEESSTQTPAEARSAPVQTPKVEPATTAAAPNSEAAQAPRESFRNSVVAPSPEGVRIVRPAAGESAEAPRPKMFIPLIVGVPSDPVSQGRALLQHGYVQEAIAELQVAATNVGPQLAEANNLLGLAYDRLGWHRQAAAAYERALTVSPKDWVVLANLGYALYLADDYGGALRRLNQAAKLAPSEPVIQNNLGIVNARLGRHGDAYKYFARASNEYEAHVKLAGILEDQQRDKDAVKHYEAALRLQPGASAVLERLVPLYERTGARDKADTARRALSQPKNPQKTATGGGG
ncbi:MAG: tetratricopeptide repeat protein [Pyrinomonadaceae bacterium]